MFAADVKIESNDVIDVTQLLPSGDTKEGVVPIEPTRTPAQPVPLRLKKCSTAHSHFRLVPPLPKENGLVPNKPTPAPALRLPVRTKKYPAAYTRLRLIPPSPTIRAATYSEPNNSAIKKYSAACNRLQQKPPLPAGRSTTSSKPNDSATDSKPNRSSTLSGPSPRQRLLPPSPPPIPSHKLPPYPHESPLRKERIHRPTSSFPLFPIRLARAVGAPEELPSTSAKDVAPEELPSTSFDNEKVPDIQSDDFKDFASQFVTPPRPLSYKRKRKRKSSANQRFPGTRELSMVGKHDVLRYTIPGGKYCYVFLFKRSNHNHDVYRCRDCKRKGALVTVKVKKWREMQQNSRYASTGNRDVYREILDAFDDETLGDAEERQKMRLIYASSGYSNRRITIARNLKRLRMMHKEALAEATDDAKDLPSEHVQASTSLLVPNKEELVHESKPPEQDSTDGSMILSSSSYLEELVKKESNEV
ncbi:hypothetical protein OSTOST_21278 [Ostertagia ostertagi]